MRKLILLLAACLLLTFMLPAVTLAQAPAGDSVVRAVLFFSPTCPHCHFVMEEVLPPLQTQYGDQLQILEIDVSQAIGGSMYEKYLAQFNIPQERTGVPALIVGDTVLVGSREIPDVFPTLIASALASGGLDWPAIEGLDQVMDPAFQELATTAPVDSSFILAWIILLGMLVALAFTAWLITKIDWQTLPRQNQQPLWLFPALALLGLLVSAYLAYVEVTHSEAVCGPVGDCNAVQSSSYATLFGIPIAIYGLIFYLAVGVLWYMQPRQATAKRHQQITAALLALTVAGTLFSIYLTALEIFTIEAVCAWCLTSAVVSTVLMLLVAIPLRQDRRQARQQRRAHTSRATR
ncbi:MAG: vitamin K epoxide reductase [Ardenticatenaceae bacterium]|nr:vitamin K epoxide reductase [Ardenticatenaceae bacterium]